MKFNIDVLALLERLKIKTSRSGAERRGHCPNPAHPSKVGPGSWQIAVSGPRAGLHCCFSCGFGGGPIALVKAKLGLAGPAAYAWLCDFAGISAPAGARAAKWTTKVIDESGVSCSYPSGCEPLWEDTLESADAVEAFDYLRGRGVTRDEMQRHRMLCVPLHGRAYAGRVIVPVVVRRELVDFVARLYVAMPPHVPKALSGRCDNGARKELSLFGYDDLDTNNDVVYVAEGVWGALALRRAGVPNVVAACGSAWSPERTELLRSWSRIYFVPDGDSAGQKMVVRAASLRFEHSVHLVRLPDGGQPDGVPVAELHRAIARAEPARFSDSSRPAAIAEWAGKR